jgi:hypothetical protein
VRGALPAHLVSQPDDRKDPVNGPKRGGNIRGDRIGAVRQFMRPPMRGPTSAVS